MLYIIVYTSMFQLLISWKTLSNSLILRAQASKQASEQANKRASKQASEQASKRTYPSLRKEDLAVLHSYIPNVPTIVKRAIEMFRIICYICIHLSFFLIPFVNALITNERYLYAQPL